jgi:hypothetical protein
MELISLSTVNYQVIKRRLKRGRVLISVNVMYQLGPIFEMIFNS